MNGGEKKCESTSSPLASFIMPLYNQQRFVNESICAILRQTEPNFELIIVDDGSTDDGYESAKVYADIDDRIKLYQNKENLNSTKTYNIAASHAKGRYIAVTASDDIYEPTYLEKVLAVKADVVYTQFVTIRAQGEVIRQHYEGEDFTFDYNRLKNRCYLFAGTLLIKRSIWEEVGGYDESFVCASDWEFAIRACKDRHVALIPESLVGYREKHMYSNRFRITEEIRAEERARIRSMYA